jgi:hypothetical protein
VPIGSHLIHRCDVQRYTETSQGYGEQRTPAAHLSDVHCRLKTEQQRAFNSLTGQWLVTTRYKLLVQFLEDITAGDRVTNIVDEYGVTDTHTYEVAGATPLRGHTLRLNKLELNKVS